MGNVFHRARTSHLRQSEIQFDRFNQTYNVTQYPKNLNFPFDNELYPITHRLNHQLHILKRMTFFSEEALNSFLNRLDHAITLKHDNLLEIESYYVQKNDMNGRIVSYSVNIIIEHFDHTLREELIVNQHDNIPFSESQVYDVLSQMADALGFLQTHNYCHGNVCPSNIYVTRENKYKLCFIGEPLYKIETGLNPHIISFMDYLAPKLRAFLNTAITTGTLPSKVFYDKHKSDIFSLGIILLQMASLRDIKCLNLAGKENERMKRVQGCQKLVAPRLLDSIKTMLMENEVKRPNFVDLKGVIQLQQDEQSDLLGLNRLRRDTYITAMPKQEPRKSSTKIDQCIEMKTIENYGENQEWANRRYDPSMIGEDNEYSMGPKSNKETLEPYRLDDEEIRKFHKDRQSQSVDPMALGHEYMQLRKRTQAPNGLAKISEEKKSERSIKAKSVFSKDDIVIMQEEDLFQPIDFQVKRLVIKLGGQPQHNNIAQVISELISTQKQLEELALTLPNMSFGDQGVITVIQGMSGLENLRVLFIEFRKDKVTVEGVKVLGHMIRKNKKLVQLGIDLATNSLSVDVCRELADALHGLGSVKSLALNVGRNRIGNEGLMEISRAISELVSLESLVLFVYSNEIDDGKAIEMLTDNVEKLQKLKSFAVDLSDNALKDESAGILLEFLKRSKTMRVSVELVNNCMSETMREKMKKEMIENPTIQLKS